MVIADKLLALEKTSEKSSDPAYVTTNPIPRRKPKSPTLLTKKAFRFACTADFFLNQNPISKYEITPTASHPKNNCRKLLLITNICIANVNSDIKQKNRL